MQWISDFRHAWRALVRAPGFLVTSVATLALAIGAVVGMFSVVNVGHDDQDRPAGELRARAPREQGGSD